MEEELLKIKQRLEALEGKKNNTRDNDDKSEKKKRAPTAYNLHMSESINRQKEEAKNAGINFDRKDAFSKAAKEWSQKKM
jgi:hypothetical protein